MSSKNISILIAVLLGVFAVVRFPTPDLRFSLRLLFEMFVAISFACYLWETNKWMAMFLVLATISVLIPFYGSVPLVSHMAFVSVFFGMVIYYIIIKTFTMRSAEYLYNAMCIIAIINLLYMGMQNLGCDPFFRHKDSVYQPVGLMLNLNLASALLAICFPAFLRKQWCWFMPAILLGLIMAKSSGGVLAVVVGTVFYFIIKGSKGSVILPVAVLCGFIYFVDKNFSIKDVRLEAWQYAMSVYKKHWIMGAGIGNWKIIGILKQQQLQNMGWTALHNDFIQGLFEMGIGYIIVLAGYICDIFKRFSKKALIPATALIVICTNATVNFPFHIGTTAMLGVVWLAILEIHLTKEVFNGSRKREREISVLHVSQGL